MKLTIELDPIADRALFDRVMAAVMNHPAPVTMESDTPSVEMSDEPDTPSVEMSDEPDTPSVEMSDTPSVEMSDEPKPRVYGEPGDGRKRRSKEEKAEDDEIERLAAETNLAVTTDVPAADLLADMKAAAAEDAAAEEEPTFDTEEEETSEEPMALDVFRAKVIEANKAHGKAAIDILSKYGSGITKIPEDKRREVIAKLEELDA